MAEVGQLDLLSRAAYAADQQEFKNGKKDTLNILGEETCLYSKRKGNFYTEIWNTPGDTIATNKYEEYYNPTTGVRLIFLGDYKDGKLVPSSRKEYYPNADGSRDGMLINYDKNGNAIDTSLFKVDKNTGAPIR
jgi:antitoxin component YwqK of YwqJK toxin-antitoxin module